MTQFFCTAGRGTEEFLVGELSTSDDHSEISKTDGKVFFTARVVTPKLLSIKCAERLFIQVLHLPNQQYFTNRDIQKLGKLIANCMSWEKVVSAFRILSDYRKDDDDNERIEPPNKKSRPAVDESNTAGADITFRISCKLSPSVGRHLDPQAVSRAIGWHIRQVLKWQVNPRQPLIEVCVHIGGHGVTVGVPTTSTPLSQRSYLQTFGLRSTVAWILAHLANIKSDSVVLDPMCGAGTILIEAEHSWPEAHYMGVDVCPKQIDRARKNVEFSGGNVNLLAGNALCLPIKDRSIDRIICDLPFGNKYLTVDAVRELLPNLLTEFNRVLRPGSHVVLLISSVLKGDLLRQAAALLKDDPHGALGEGSGVEESPRDELTQTGRHLDSGGPQSEAELAGNHSQSFCCKSATEPSFYDTREEKGSKVCPLETVEVDRGCIITDKRKGTGSSEDKDGSSAQAWSVTRVHFIKLGETQSHVCVFSKTSC